MGFITQPNYINLVIYLCDVIFLNAVFSISLSGKSSININKQYNNKIKIIMNRYNKLSYKSK